MLYNDKSFYAGLTIKFLGIMVNLTCLWKFVKIRFSVEWMKFSTRSWSPNHLKWMVTNL